MVSSQSQLSAKQLHLASAGLRQLPSEWEIVEIQELLSTDRGISVGVMYPGGHDPNGIPLIRAGDLSGSIINSNPELCITPEKHKEYSRTEFSGSEILMTLVGDVGQCAVVPKGMAGWNAARAISVIRLAEASDAQYVRLCLMSRPIRHLMNVWSNTTVQATLNLKEVKRLPIPWPPKSTRDKIAKIASSLDSKIELNRRMNRTLEAIAQAIFKSWFVNFEPVKAKQQAKAAGESVELAAMMALSGKSAAEIDQLPTAQRDSLAETAALFPERLVESELGLIPEGWEVETIDSTISLIIDHRGKTPKKLGSDWQASGYPAISAKNLKKGRIVNRDSIRFLDDKIYKKWMKDELERGDILLTSEAPLGELYYLATDTKYVLSQRLYALRAEPTKLTGIFLYCWLGATSAQCDLESRATGSVAVGIRQSELRKVNVLVPLSGVLEKFSNTAESVMTQVASSETNSKTLARLRDTLLPKLLSGELTIPDAIAQTEEAIR